MSLVKKLERSLGWMAIGNLPVYVVSAQAILFVWRNAGADLNVYGIGVESRTRVSEIARMVIEEMGLSAKIRYTGGARGWIGDVPEFDYDLARIHALGWAASTTSNEAVRKSIRHILDSGIA